MFIQTEETPNPETLKFLVGTVVAGDHVVDYGSKDEVGSSSLLALKLFSVGGVSRIFFGEDFISVTKNEQEDWGILKPSLLSVMSDHFAMGLPAFDQIEKTDVICDEKDIPIVAQIQDIIETRIRPFVVRDGGDIVVHKYEDGIVYVTLKGACVGCPSSQMTLKAGIENMLCHFIPEVKEVQPFEG